MKNLATIILSLFLAVSSFGATVVYAPLQVNKTTGALPVGSTFISANSNAIVSIVGQNQGATNILVVSPNGNDGTAVVGNAAKPFATLGAAVTAAPNNSVISFLPGDYNQTPGYVSSGAVNGFGGMPVMIQNKTNITIAGNGARITGSGTGTHIGLMSTEGIRISGLTFSLTKGLGSGLTNDYCGTIQGFGTNKNLSVIGCSILNATDQGITSSRKLYGLLVDGCYFYNIGVTNVAYVSGAVQPPFVDGTAVSGGGSDTRIVNCRFEDCFRCIEWDNVLASTEIHSGMFVANNFITNCFDTSIFTFSPQTNTYPLTDITITGNTIHHCTDARGINSHTWPSTNGTRFDAAIKIGVGKNVVIQGNSIRHVHDYPITVTGNSLCENLIISDNVIEGHTGTSTTNSNNGGIWIADTGRADNYNQVKGVLIANNLIRNLGNRGMILSGYNVNVVGNSILDCQQLNTGGLYDFHVDGATYHASNIVFRANFRNDTRTATPKNYALAVSTGSKQVFWDASNLALNCNTTTAPTNYPMSLGASTGSEVYFHGKSGQVTMASGTASIVFPAMRTTTKLNITRVTSTGTAGTITYAITAGTGAVISSSSGTDAGVFNWSISEETP